MSLGHPSVRDRATQMGITNMKKDTERGYLAHFQILRILTQFNHWPTEALESNPLKIPLLRILHLASTLKDPELDNPPPLLHTNDVTASLRAASQAVDGDRMEKRHTLQCTMETKDIYGLVR